MKKALGWAVGLSAVGLTAWYLQKSDADQAVVWQDLWDAADQGLTTLQTVGNTVVQAGKEFFGTPGIDANNPGNLIYNPATSWVGQTGSWHSVKSGHDFCTFDTPENGLRAMSINSLTQIGKGLYTLRDFGDVWAPASDNSGDDGYGKRLASNISSATGQTFDQDDNFDFYLYLPQLIAAIVHNENGVQPYPSYLIAQACNVAVAYKGISTGVAYA